jgi:hypothetical protein
MDTAVRKELSTITNYMRWMIVVHNVSGEPQQTFTNLIRLYKYVKERKESSKGYEIGSIESILLDSILDAKRGVSDVTCIEITAYQRNKV